MTATTNMERLNMVPRNPSIVLYAYRAIIIVAR